MHSKRFIGFVLGCVVAVALSGGLWRLLRPDPLAYTVFDQAGRRAVIIVPAHPSPAELAAAELLRTTLGRAAGTDPFPLQRESRWRFWQEGIYVGETDRARAAPPLPGKAKWERAVASEVQPGAIILRSRWPEDIQLTVSWWLEKQVGARWFIPGLLGESVSKRDRLRIELGAQVHAASFVSRNVSGLSSPQEKSWYDANRLKAVFSHGHSMSAIYQPADLARMPELAPWINSRKYVPKSADEQGWQPNLLPESAITHAAEVLRKRFLAEPDLLSASVGMNDTIGYDQSPATLEAVAPARYFRHQPDYANLVFDYTNKIARRLAPEFPDRFITTYAYYWTENTPTFAIEPNVIPYLTTDRSQWFDPDYAQEDQALIKRWVAAGSQIVGIYDYYYGAPFLVPRPTLYAVGQSIPFAHEAGVRAFYAEIYPNWGLDGPKSWLAAQLLWDAKQDPAQLLDIYYREFWQDSAGPMRKFFELCDRQWLNQPRPAYWLKYYKDEHQFRLFPSPVCRELRALLDEAKGLARSEIVMRRLALTSEAFAVAEAFVDFNEAREALSRLAMPEQPVAAGLILAAKTMQEARRALEQRMVRVKKEHPLAVHAATLMEEYTRNDPRRRALGRLRSELDQLRSHPDFPAAFGDLVGGHVPAVAEGKQLAVDSQFTQVVLRPVSGFTALNWVQAGAWRGYGEPYETRKITLEAGAGSGGAMLQGQAPRVIRFEGCKQDTFSQWLPGRAGRWYLATVQARAKVSPGNMTFLIVNFLDEKGQHLRIGILDRLPVGTWDHPLELAVFIEAPPQTVQIGLGVRVLNQVDDDYAEFSQLSLTEFVGQGER